MRIAWLFVIACSSAPPAQPVAPVKPPAPVAATCADVGVILRGELSEDVSPEAGPAREAAIAKACTDDRWPQPVIDCVASQRTPEPCLDRLDQKQVAALEANLQAWTARHAREEPPPAAPPALACSAAIHDEAHYPPAIDEEREWVVKVRRATLLEECDHHWNDELKACVHKAADQAALASCLHDKLSKDERDELADKFAALRSLAKGIAKARKKPARITCKRMVAAHYGDAKWTDKIRGYTSAERKKMIEASRARMSKACTADNWDETLRACVVAGGLDLCFESYGMSLLWGYPAAGVVTSIGIAECDAYAAAVTKITKCTKLQQDSRDALLQSFLKMQAQMAGRSAADRKNLGTTCQAGLDAINQIATGLGC